MTLRIVNHTSDKWNVDLHEIKRLDWLEYGPYLTMVLKSFRKALRINLQLPNNVCNGDCVARFCQQEVCQ
jgi:hypothetical protein